MTARSAFGIALTATGLVALTSLAGACGGPVLQNAPYPDPAIVAAAAAATAGAITIADPDGAARNVANEYEYHSVVGPVMKTRGKTAPADVLDRLDAAEREKKLQKPQPPGGPGAPTDPASTPSDPDAEPDAQ